jgi:hypothetical protein
MSIVIPNFARTTLRAAITPASTQLLLAAGTGAYFNIGSGNYLYATIEDGNQVEIVLYNCTGVVVNDTITVLRGQDGTSAKAFPAGACVKVAWNVQQVEDLVTQTFISLFDSTNLPPNTTQVTDVPAAPPEPNVIYAIWITEHRFWYWTGASWIEIGNPRDSVLAGSGDPSGTPATNVAFYVNTDTGELWYWTGSAWMSVAGGNTSTEEYWNRGASGNLYSLVPESQVELGVINMIDRYRTYPNGVAANTILQVIDQGGNPRTTLLENAALEITVSVLLGFFSVPVSNAVFNLVISNSENDLLFGNAFTVDVDFAPDISINVSTGVMPWSAGTYFDGNLVYSEVGAGPWNTATIKQVHTVFHVVEAGIPIIG